MQISASLQCNGSRSVLQLSDDDSTVSNLRALGGPGATEGRDMVTQGPGVLQGFDRGSPSLPWPLHAKDTDLHGQVKSSSSWILGKRGKTS
jgi:hypothetical protein